MNRERFQALADEGYNRIPLICEAPADLDTPLSTYLKLAEGPHSYLLESVHGGEKWGRYSIIGLPCRQVLTVHGREVRVHDRGELIESRTVDDPLAYVEAFKARYRSAPVNLGSLRFTGGLVGYFGYDTIRYIEKRLADCPNPDPLGTPDILLLVSEEVVVFDNLAGKLYVIVHADPGRSGAYDQAEARVRELIGKLSTAVPAYGETARQSPVAETDFVSGFTREGFEAAVTKAREYIADGDAMQVVLSQRMSIPFDSRPLDLYRALRALNPSPYMYFLDLGAFQIVGSSPEILVRLEDDEVTVRPIAGTRRRGHTEVEDQALEEELLADPKERAEHLMLIDLGRNDAGRVAETGTVEVTEKMVIERYSHVMHIVSNVRGKLRPEMGAMDVLRATFPAGTVSGAPKVRAMEIIDELEPVKRGVYAGAVGYWAFSGAMDTAIAIRTAVIKDGRLHIQAGAGVVYDSRPELEWKETMNKGRAIFRAVAAAGAGFRVSGCEGA